MKIEVYNQYGEIPFPFRSIIDKIESVFSSSLKEISLILVTIEEIHELNKQYRNIDRPTDVLSFDSDDDDYIGDIFVCIDIAILQANEYGHSIDREFAFLVVHGVLHLLGYDHDTTENETLMIQKQNELLDRMNYRRE